MSEPVGPVEFSLEEMEQQEKQTAPDLSQVKLDGDGIPELLRGKSVADALKHVQTLEQAVKLSEQARQQAELTAQTALKSQPVAAPPAPEEPAELNPDQLKELYDEDPIRAIEVMSAQSIRRAEKNLEARLGPLFNGGAASAEATARQKYGTEFELFGEDITRMAASIPNSKAVLANPQAWDELIALVRGRPGNFEKIIERRTSKVTDQQRVDAQQQQAASIGFTESSPQRGRPVTTVAALDPIQREIADKLGLTPEEYVKWSKV